MTDRKKRINSMTEDEYTEAMKDRLNQADFLLSILRYAVADCASEYWQRRALYVSIESIRSGLASKLNSEEPATNQYDFNEAWRILSAWDDESDEDQCAERIEGIKKRFTQRRTPDDTMLYDEMQNNDESEV